LGPKNQALFAHIGYLYQIGMNVFPFFIWLFILPAHTSSRTWLCLCGKTPPPSIHAHRRISTTHAYDFQATPYFV
jgi:hypothetical protein